MLQVNRRQLLKAGGALGAVSTMSPVVMASAGEADLSGLPRVKQELVAPPYVPAHEQTTMDGRDGLGRRGGPQRPARRSSRPPWTARRSSRWNSSPPRK